MRFGFKVARTKEQGNTRKVFERKKKERKYENSQQSLSLIL